MLSEKVNILLLLLLLLLLLYIYIYIESLEKDLFAKKHKNFT